MWFFVFSINFARTREGRPARRKLTELLVKSKKTLVTEPAAIFFVFQVNISCKTTSIILYFKYASFSVVTRKKRQNTNPHPDGNFFDDRFGLGILRDGQNCAKHYPFSCTKCSYHIKEKFEVNFRRESTPLFRKFSKCDIRFGHKTVSKKRVIYMLFTRREVRIGKNCARGLEYSPRPKAEGRTRDREHSFSLHGPTKAGE